MNMLLHLTLTLLYLTLVTSNLEHDGSVSIRILHTFDVSENPVFKDRGNITIQSLRVGQATIQQNALTFDDKKKLRVCFCFCVFFMS